MQGVSGRVAGTAENLRYPRFGIAHLLGDGFSITGVDEKHGNGLDTAAAKAVKRVGVKHGARCEQCVTVTVENSRRQRHPRCDPPGGQDDGA